MEEIGPEEFDKQLNANEVLYLLLYSPTDTRTPVRVVQPWSGLMMTETSLTGAGGERVWYIARVSSRLYVQLR